MNQKSLFCCTSSSAINKKEDDNTAKDFWDIEITVKFKIKLYFKCSVGFLAIAVMQLYST